MSEHLAYLGSRFVLVYGILLGIYLIGGLVISWTNQRRRAKKIQSGNHPAPGLVRRDILKSIGSLAFISLLFSLGDWLQWCGIGWAPADLTLWSVIWQAALSLLLFDTWFYWAHRLVHHPRIYSRVHRFHHTVRTPTVWSNNSDTLLDNVIVQSYWMVVQLIFPVIPGIKLAHKIYDQITGMLGHSGYEYSGKMSFFPSPLLGVTHHDQHHEYFVYNFATHFSLWDRLMGTLHPSYDARLRELVEMDDLDPELKKSAA